MFLNQQGIRVLYLLKGALGLKCGEFFLWWKKLRIDPLLCRKKENHGMIWKSEDKEVKGKDFEQQGRGLKTPLGNP